MECGRCAPSPAKGAEPPLNPINWGYPLGNERGSAPWFWGPGAPPLVWGLGTAGPQNLTLTPSPLGEGRGGVKIEWARSAHHLKGRSPF